MQRATPTIIVLLGHHNDRDGNLSAVAIDRCVGALNAAAAYPNAKVIPTGGFGRGFNVSTRPHGHWLMRELIRTGLPSERIMPTTLGSRTIEDALFVRKIILDTGAEAAVIVTSRYHMERAAFIFSRILPEIDLTLVSTDVQPDPDEAKSEETNRIETIRDWISFPLIGKGKDCYVFPQHVYQNAADEHRKYDQILYAVLAAAFIVFAFPHAFLDSQRKIWPPIAYLLSSLAIVGFLIVYHRATVWAHTARQTLYLIEAQWNQPGFSYNIRHGNLSTPLTGGFGWLARHGIFKTAKIGMIAMIAINAATAAALTADLILNCVR